MKAQLEQMKIEQGLQIQAMRDQTAKELEVLKAQLQALVDANNPANMPIDEGPGVDADTLIRGDIDLRKAMIKDQGDTERALIKESAATEREMIKADVAARGQDLDVEGKVMDVGVALARDVMRPDVNGEAT
jgi:hypothetical protein